MLHNRLAAHAVAKLRDLISDARDQVDDRRAHWKAARLDPGDESAQLDVGAQAEVRVVEAPVDLVLLAARPVLQINGSQGCLPVAVCLLPWGTFYHRNPLA